MKKAIIILSNINRFDVIAHINRQREYAKLLSKNSKPMKLKQKRTLKFWK